MHSFLNTAADKYKISYFTCNYYFFKQSYIFLKGPWVHCNFSCIFKVKEEISTSWYLVLYAFMFLYNDLMLTYTLGGNWVPDNKHL